ncbi:MAG: HAD family phosphatase [Leptolyngbya sp. LCM1.Bin17]|nr:MAG: HAD family phosphatase [Leptolyngbya sp. LCM1.Bin17]
MDQIQPKTLNHFRSIAGQVKLIATDMDGTLTRQGHFSGDLLRGLERLQQAGWPVVIVTGRSAGWVQAIAHYLPVAGAMAENGGVYFPGARAAAVPLVSLPSITAHRHQLGDLFAQLQTQWPRLQESSDNRFRLTDWTFDIDGLSPADLDGLADVCQTQGWGFTYSTVQCHCFKPGQAKATGLQQMLQRYFPHLSTQDIVTVGDSPNDASLFDPALFPYSVGVANVQDYWEQLPHHPTYVTEAPEVDGFLELANRLLA